MAIKTKIKTRVRKFDKTLRISTLWKRTPSAGEIRRVERDKYGNITFDSHGNYLTVFETKEPTHEQTNVWYGRSILSPTFELIGSYDVFETTLKVNSRTEERHMFITINDRKLTVEPLSKNTMRELGISTELWIITGFLEE